MSGKPHQTGAKRVHDLIIKLQELQGEGEEIARLLRRQKTLRDEQETLTKELHDLLRSMDVDAKGNFGWENRFGWLLSEIMNETRRALKSEP